MGRTQTPKYRVEIDTIGRFKISNMCWFVKENGRPTIKNLTTYIEELEQSTQPDGVQIVSARIVRQSTRETIISITRR